MPGENVPAKGQEPVPALGTLMVDTQERVGEFRGEWCGLWSLRPVTGGTEWTVAPEDARPASAEQRLRAKTARANARSRGEVL
ncbi:hypothetical protein ACFXKG_14540 [Streptomyces sp. NPDC059255]|uniref:hypothetical protein n=1 Tax=Streptomyces sp. NPDC059255 TaxID=3346793 RepID=UPI0036B5C2A0